MVEGLIGCIAGMMLTAMIGGLYYLGSLKAKELFECFQVAKTSIGYRGDEILREKRERREDSDRMLRQIESLHANHLTLQDALNTLTQNMKAGAFAHTEKSEQEADRRMDGADGYFDASSAI